MKITKLIISGLYGYFTKEIIFQSGINLLVGINGSGKTTILNVLHWLLKPSIPNLCTIDFQMLSLNFEYNDKVYEIRCEQTENIVSLSVQEGDMVLGTLRASLKKPPGEFSSVSDRNRYLETYHSLSPDKHEVSVWNFLRSLPKLTVIGLDRVSFTEESDEIFIENSELGRRIRRQQQKLESPLDRVKELVNAEYRRSRNEVHLLTQELKNQLMLSAFEGSISMESLSAAGKQTLTVEQIDRARKRIIDYLTEYEPNILSDSGRTQITAYFDGMRKIIEEHAIRPKDEVTKFLYGLNAHQFRKINKLMSRMESFEERGRETMAKIENFLTIINSVLSDSAKLLTFDEDSAGIVYNILDKNEAIIEHKRDITFLSSGEQQTLILFSYIAFGSHDGRVFLIDEPELSLHVKWQETFLANIENLMPANTQLILATHSPILVAKERERVIALLPYNS